MTPKPKLDYVTRRVITGIQNGLHMRPSAEIKRIAAAYTHLEASLQSAAGVAKTASMMGIMGLGIAYGTPVDIHVTRGPGAEELVQKLSQYISAVDTGQLAEQRI